MRVVGTKGPTSTPDVQGMGSGSCHLAESVQAGFIQWFLRVNNPHTSYSEPAQHTDNKEIHCIKGDPSVQLLSGLQMTDSTFIILSITMSDY